MERKLSVGEGDEVEEGEEEGMDGMVGEEEEDDDDDDDDLRVGRGVGEDGEARREVIEGILCVGVSMNENGRMS